MFSDVEINRYTRQIQLENIGLAGQAKLKNARMLCIGAGGLANPLLLYSAAAGVGTLGVIDDDVIELSNLQRQVLYQQQHKGHKKVGVAQQQIKALNPWVNVVTYDERLIATNAGSIIEQYDIVADCTDNFYTRYLINDHCFLQQKPFVSASIYQFAGQCTTFLGAHGPCYRCLFPTPPGRDAIPDCNEAGVLGVLPGILGMLQATEIIKWVLNVGELLVGRLLLFDALKMQYREIKYSQNSDCLLCAQKKIDQLLYPVETCVMYQEILCQELHQRLSNQEDIFLLDVRTPEERASYHIGGMLIPLSELPQRLHELNPQQHIVAYCRSGGRSLQAVEILSSAGFKSVQSLRDGVTAVQQAGLIFPN